MAAGTHDVVDFISVRKLFIACEENTMHQVVARSFCFMTVVEAQAWMLVHPVESNHQLRYAAMQSCYLAARLTTIIKLY